MVPVESMMRFFWEKRNEMGDYWIGVVVDWDREDGWSWVVGIKKGWWWELGVKGSY